jgi:hypothetical protein
MAEVPEFDPEVLDQAQKMIDEATSQAAAASESGKVLFGMTFAGLMVASFLSLLGVAYLVYARRQGRLIIGLCGVALMVVPFFVTDTILMSVAGGVLVSLPAILKRLGIDL